MNRISQVVLSIAVLAPFTSIVPALLFLVHGDADLFWLVRPIEFAVSEHLALALGHYLSMIPLGFFELMRSFGIYDFSYSAWLTVAFCITCFKVIVTGLSNIFPKKSPFPPTILKGLPRMDGLAMKSLDGKLYIHAWQHNLRPARAAFVYLLVLLSPLVVAFGAAALLTAIDDRGAAFVAIFLMIPVFVVGFPIAVAMCVGAVFFLLKLPYILVAVLSFNPRQILLSKSGEGWVAQVDKGREFEISLENIEVVEIKASSFVIGGQRSTVVTAYAGSPGFVTGMVAIDAAQQTSRSLGVLLRNGMSFIHHRSNFGVRIGPKIAVEYLSYEEAVHYVRLIRGEAGKA